MKHLFIFTLIVLLVTPAFSQQKENSETSTFYFIRHAEKDRSDAKNRNPNLIAKGLSRAAKWNKVLENVKFDNVYSTNYNRTKQTALPTAEKNNLEITLYDPRNIDGSAFIKNNKGKTVLVVGHSNTTPAFVNAVIGSKKYKDIDDSNNANIYIVTIASDGSISDTLLVIE